MTLLGTGQQFFGIKKENWATEVFGIMRNVPDRLRPLITGFNRFRCLTIIYPPIKTFDPAIKSPNP